MLLSLVVSAALAAAPVYGPRLEGFDYPHPVKTFALHSQRQDLEMAYLDVPPSSDRPSGQTVLLLHGKNFCAATWEDTIAALAAAGHRVIAPDQIGFCKSSKPAAYQYSLETLALNTAALLDSLGIEEVVVAGHSMGGMLAMRFAMEHPGRTARLLLINPIGLEDWKARGVPAVTVDRWLAAEQKKTRAGIRAYQLSSYYGGVWRPEYDRWVDMLAGMVEGPGAEAVAWSQALTADMVFNQPVVYELDRIRAPTTLFVGQRDRTALGRGFVDAALGASLGDYPALGKATAAAIADCTLVELDNLGHSPHVEAPARFLPQLVAAVGG